MCACVCVCVRERERERGGGGNNCFVAHKCSKSCILQTSSSFCASQIFFIMVVPIRAMS